jgi:7,8-dihydropterin-6-yl-methyl-4-(beta-D-ribofuranosyl)aminobenzene 5'-phosphate synthase
LSHGHYDHTGGLPAILEAEPKTPIYLHPAALQEKYSQRSDGRSQFIGMNPKTVQGFRDRRNHIETIGCTQTMEGVFVTGEIPRLNAYEDTGGPFFQDAACMQPDPLPDDQALVIDLGSSVIVLLGCAHSGVVNTLDHIDTLTHGKPVSAVIGGLHLSSANEVRMEKTMDRLRAANLQCLAPAHCTGWSATDRLRRAFPKIIRSAEVGTMLDFKRE